MTELDGEAIGQWEPKAAGFVLALGFDDMEEMMLFQERVQAAHRQDRDDEGAAVGQVETLWMGRSQFGRRPAFEGQVATGLLVATAEELEMTEQARRAWAQKRMQLASPIKERRGVSLSWAPSSDQMDMLDRFAIEVLEPDPAGGGPTSRRIKTSVARAGFNAFALDKDRPDLQFTGSNGGKAFSETIKAMFKGHVQVRQSDGGHPYFHGLQRRNGVNRKYWRLP